MTGHALPTATGPVVGEVIVPGSKSETNRALLLAALSDGPSTVSGALRSRDSDLMVAALRAFGVAITEAGDGALDVTPPATLTAPSTSIDCGLAGTVMRFVPPLALVAGAPTSFHGDPQASERPMAGLLDGLRQLGGTVDGDRLPFTLTPSSSPAAPEVEIDSTASSQFISGLLLIGARLPAGLRLRHIGRGLPSRPHIEMTTAMLRDRGVTIDEPDATSWVVHPGPIVARDARIEPDLTNAAAFLATAAMTEGSVTVRDWPATSLQPGALFLDIVTRMGPSVTVDDRGATVTGSGRLLGGDVDLHAASELTPVVAALAAVAEGRTTISGVGHIRGHETDRLKALATELGALGVDVIETPDGLVIDGVSRQPLRVGAPFETYADHRLVHTAALLALRTPGLVVTDMACVGKTMPDFPDRWSALVGG